MSLFDRLDVNRDGVISRAEFNQALHGASAFPASGMVTTAPARTLPQFPLPRDSLAAYQANQSLQPGVPLPYAAAAQRPLHSSYAQAPAVHYASEPVVHQVAPLQQAVYAPPAVYHHQAEVLPTYAPAGLSTERHALYSSVPVSPARSHFGGQPLSRSVSSAVPTLGPPLRSEALVSRAAPSRLDLPGGFHDRIVGERPISREELASTGNLIEGPPLEAWQQEQPITYLAAERPTTYLAAERPTTYLSAAPVARSSAAVVLAAEPVQAAPSSLFDRLDANHDGIITREEFNQGTHLGAGPVAII